MRLDFRTPAAGRVRIGIDGVEGRSAADCDPLAGDHAGQPVTWRGGEADLGVPADRPVSLHVSAAQRGAVLDHVRLTQRPAPPERMPCSRRNPTTSGSGVGQSLCPHAMGTGVVPAARASASPCA